MKEINKRKKNILYILLVCMVVYTFRYDFGYFLNEKISYKYELQELTTEQKEEDFEIWYENIISSVPFLEQVKELYGLDFRQRKEYYLDEIRKTQSNVEFYGVMKAISKDIVSFHTDVCFPMYSNLRGLNCYNSDDVLSEFGMKSKMNAWWDELGNTFEEYKEINWFNVAYAEGKYVVKEATLPEKYQWMEGYELVAVDGVEADKYLIDNISIYSISYDYNLDKPYRTTYTFNDKVGEQVEVVWKSQEGKQITQTMFLDKNIELMASFGYLYGEEYNYYTNITEESVTMVRDNENQLEYIKINNFSNNQGEELKSYLKTTPYNKIVIDLSDNHGGNVNYATEYLYPELHQTYAQLIYGWKVPDTPQNKKMTKSMYLRLLCSPKKQGGYYHYENIVEFAGEQEEEKDVYYIIGKGTGSAADTYISMIKEQGLGTIIGTNTGGEGLGASFICDTLENSSLIYIYYPSIQTKHKGNSCTGTTPDIYIEQTVEDYKLKEKCKMEGTALEYQWRLQYDTALKYIIKES